MRNFLLLLLYWCFWASVSASPVFQLESGDLLFQDLNCGKFCDSIDSVTYGYDNTYVSHVALVIDATKSHSRVIEAASRGVIITPLNEFLQRSLDSQYHPRVMVGRLKPQYRYLIPKAIANAKNELGKPYNDSFIPSSGKSYYCSELIADSFYAANNNRTFFHTHPMNFADSKGKILPLWDDYYNKLKIKVPQGVLGSNPGMMSRESMLVIIYYYGSLRRH